MQLHHQRMARLIRVVIPNWYLADYPEVLPFSMDGSMKRVFPQLAEAMLGHDWLMRVSGLTRISSINRLNI